MHVESNEFSIWKEVHDVSIGLLGTLMSFLFGLFWLWARRNIYGYLIIKRKIISILLNRRYVLIWNDDTIETSKDITFQLERKGLKGCIFKELKSPTEILYYSAKDSYTQAIILIVTDVTKLDENDLKRDRIQRKLRTYVENGGTLIGTHDLIYRRCRNKDLQKIFGCELYRFQRLSKPIAVEINAGYRSHPLLRNIPTTFTFNDGEIVMGEWDENVMKLALSKDPYFDTQEFIPMICLKYHRNEGQTIWISCGDKSDKLPGSLKPLQAEFIEILFNAIKYNKHVKQRAPEATHVIMRPHII